MKNLLTFLQITGLCLTALFMSACPTEFDASSSDKNKTEIPAGKGVITLNIAVPETARTILPGASENFVYTATFALNGGAPSAAKPFINGKLVTEPLVYGDWTVTIYAAWNDGSKNIVVGRAIINAHLHLQNREPEYKGIIIEPYSEDPAVTKGTFTWNIGYPANIKTAALSIVSSDKTYSKEIDLENPADNPETLTLPLGSYRIWVHLVNNANQRASRINVIHIYPGLTTNVEWPFTDADFRGVMDVHVSVNINLPANTSITEAELSNETDIASLVLPHTGSAYSFILKAADNESELSDLTLNLKTTHNDLTIPLSGPFPINPLNFTVALDDINIYALTISAGANGSVSGIVTEDIGANGNITNITTSSGTKQRDLLAGYEVKLSAAPAGSAVASWIIDPPDALHEVNSAGDRIIIMPEEDVSVEVFFLTSVAIESFTAVNNQDYWFRDFMNVTYRYWLVTQADDGSTHAFNSAAVGYTNPNLPGGTSDPAKRPRYVQVTPTGGAVGSASLGMQIGRVFQDGQIVDVSHMSSIVISMKRFAANTSGSFSFSLYSGAAWVNGTTQASGNRSTVSFTLPADTNWNDIYIPVDMFRDHASGNVNLAAVNAWSINAAPGTLTEGENGRFFIDYIGADPVRYYTVNVDPNIDSSLGIVKIGTSQSTVDKIYLSFKPTEITGVSVYIQVTSSDHDAFGIPKAIGGAAVPMTSHGGGLYSFSMIPADLVIKGHKTIEGFKVSGGDNNWFSDLTNPGDGRRSGWLINQPGDGRTGITNISVTTGDSGLALGDTSSVNRPRVLTVTPAPIDSGSGLQVGRVFTSGEFARPSFDITGMGSVVVSFKRFTANNSGSYSLSLYGGADWTTTNSGTVEPEYTGKATVEFTPLPHTEWQEIYIPVKDFNGVTTVNAWAINVAAGMEQGVNGRFHIDYIGVVTELYEYDVAIGAISGNGTIQAGLQPDGSDKADFLPNTPAGKTVYIFAQGTPPYAIVGKPAVSGVQASYVMFVSPGVWKFVMPAKDVSITASFVDSDTLGSKVIYSNGVFNSDYEFSITDNTVAPGWWTGGAVFVNSDYTLTSEAKNGANTKAMRIFREDPGGVSFSIVSDIPVILNNTGGLIFRIWCDGDDGNPIQWIGFGDGSNSVVWQGNENNHNFNPTMQINSSGNISGGWGGQPSGWYTMFIPVPAAKTSGLEITTVFSIRITLNANRQYLIDDIQFVSSHDVEVTKITLQADYPGSLEVGDTLNAVNAIYGLDTKIIYSADLNTYVNFGSTVYTRIAAQNISNDGGRMQTFINWPLANAIVLTSSNTSAASIVNGSVILGESVGSTNITARIGNTVSDNSMTLNIIPSVVSKVIENVNHGGGWTSDGQINQRGYWFKYMSGRGTQEDIDGTVNDGVTRVFDGNFGRFPAFNGGSWRLTPTPNQTAEFGRRFGHNFDNANESASMNINRFNRVSFRFMKGTYITDAAYSFAFTNGGSFKIGRTKDETIGTMYAVDFTGQVTAASETDWVEISIPISAFKNIGIDPTVVTGFAVIVNRTNGSAPADNDEDSIYMDDFILYLNP